PTSTVWPMGFSRYTSFPARMARSAARSHRQASLLVRIALTCSGHEPRRSSRCNLRDERAPISVKNHSRRVYLDHLGAHPDITSLIRDCRRIVTPSRDAEAKRLVTAQGVVRADTRSRDDDRADTTKGVERGIGRAGEEVLSNDRERDSRF